MNYFELFEIPIRFEIDKGQLKRKFYALSKKFHPDRFTLQSKEEQVQALNKSTELNKAYRILSDDQKRIRYILEISGIPFREGEEKVSQDFLMQMMEINEGVMEWQMDPDPETREMLVGQLNEFRTSLSEEIAPVMARIDLSDPDRDDLEQIKDYYLKSKYISRLAERINH